MGSMQYAPVRTRAMFETYQEWKRAEGVPKECVLCTEEPKIEYRHWKLMANKFPYDAIAEKHMMLVPKRHFATSRDMSEEERAELENLKENELSEYDSLMENLVKMKSIKDHFHFHLLKLIREEASFERSRENDHELLFGNEANRSS